MVRVISEKLFSPPRSRHSSGETVDKELAGAIEALSGFDSKRFELSDYESSSDSHWDSELDVDGDSQEPFKFGQSDGSVGGEDIVKRRKERRRERNKLSAQAYRMRRREQSVKTQKVLSTLEEENTRLKNKVKDLENEINSIRQSVSGSSGQRLQASQQPALLKSSPPPPIPSTRPPESGQSPFSQIANGNAVGGGLLKTSMFPSSVGQQKQQQQQQPVDNDQLQPRHQAPVDNFLFTQHATQVTMATPFGFPTGAAPTLTAAPTITTTTSITMATPPRHHPHTLHSDLNANASVITNGNAMGGGACQNDNMNNNNGNNLLLVLPVGQGHARHHSFNNLTNAL